MSISIFEVQIDKDASLVMPSQQQDIINALNASGNPIADVVVISHGWNNDMDEARTLYRDFFRSFEQIAPAAAAKMLAIGILWPSKKFADTDLIPGGAAAATTDPVPDQVLLDQLQTVEGVFDDMETDEKLDQMKTLVAGISNDTNKQNQFVELMGQILDKHTDPAQRSEDEGTVTVTRRAQQPNGGANLLKTFGQPIGPTVKKGGGGGANMGGIVGNPALRQSAAGPAADLSDFLSGVKAGALRLINYVTYYVMKDRAGRIGRDAVNPLIQRIQAAVPRSIRFHLVGHSFGGRLVTAAADGPNALRIQSMLLLQAAYSHNGLSKSFDPQNPMNSGFFHNVFDMHKITGPILITHSNKDKAVGLAYPLASRLNRDDATAIGDANDLFGGMGANGAQHIDRVDINLLTVGSGTYDFTSSGKLVFNLNGDSIIQGHGDVARPETAAVLAAAIAQSSAHLTTTGAAVGP